MLHSIPGTGFLGVLRSADSFVIAYLLHCGRGRDISLSVGFATMRSWLDLPAATEICAKATSVRFAYVK